MRKMAPLSLGLQAFVFDSKGLMEKYWLYSTLHATYFTLTDNFLGYSRLQWVAFLVRDRLFKLIMNLEKTGVGNNPPWKFQFLIFNNNNLNEQKHS